MDGQRPSAYDRQMNESSIGVVVIGRNEGERLRVCLASLSDVQARVYVDSGSTDGSCALARTLGFDVVELTLPPGFTAARARNAGIERLVEQSPGLAYVQTVDGDCEVRTDWLENARRGLEEDGERAVVFGRRRERYPRANVYHTACDDEWNVRVGEVLSCGGDALFRITALKEVGGFNPLLIAGEELDLCLRLRQHGWCIWSSGCEMTLHDVAIERFQQWWRRSRRTGFAFAELVDMHQAGADPAWSRLLQSALTWSVVALVALTAAIFGLAWQQPVAVKIAVFFSAMFVLQLVRMALRQRGRVDGLGNGFKLACMIMVAKAAQSVGWVQYKLNRVTGAPTSIIEYKR